MVHSTSWAQAGQTLAQAISPQTGVMGRDKTFPHYTDTYPVPKVNYGVLGI